MNGYRRSKLAQRDIDAIWDHIVEHGGVAGAERFAWRLHYLFGPLGAHPAMGRMSRVVARGVRKFPLGDYIVNYVSEGRRVSIARILHGKRRQRKAFRGE